MIASCSVILDTFMKVLPALSIALALSLGALHAAGRYLPRGVSEQKCTNAQRELPLMFG